MKLITTIIDQLPKVSKWQKDFFKAIITGFLGVTGRLNFRNISRYLSMHEKTISRNFAKLFPFLQVNATLIQQVVEECSVLAFDPLFIPKSGKKTEGKDMFWNGCAGKAVAGIEFGLIALINVVKNVAYPLHARQTLDKLKQEGESRVDLYIAHLTWAITELRKSVGIIIKCVLVDSFFYKEKFVTHMLSLGVHVISKMRIDARLRHVYTGSQKSRGRHKKYTEAVSWDNLEAFEMVKSPEDPELTLYSAIANSIVLGINMRVVYLVKTVEGKEWRAILFSTDTNMTALDILKHYRARFQIEFVIRDAKQHTGLADCQSLVANRLDFHVNTSFTALLVAKVMDEQALQFSSVRSTFSMLNHKLRNHNEMLLKRISSMLGFDLLPIKSSPLYEQIINIGTISYCS
jgi:hypothetical protein